MELANPFKKYFREVNVAVVLAMLVFVSSSFARNLYPEKGDIVSFSRDLTCNHRVLPEPVTLYKGEEVEIDQVSHKKVQGPRGDFYYVAVYFGGCRKWVSAELIN